MEYHAAMIMRIPFFKQINSDYCGPAVLQMILCARGIKITQKKAAALAHTSRARGTMPTGLVAALRKNGLMVAVKSGCTIRDLKRALAGHKLPIVCYTERRWNWGHYSIVLGFKGNHIILQDPAEHLGKHAPFTTKEFEKCWEDPKFTKSDHWAAFVQP